jgi:hypothetical protein
MKDIEFLFHKNMEYYRIQQLNISLQIILAINFLIFIMWNELVRSTRFIINWLILYNQNHLLILLETSYIHNHLLDEN